MIKLERFIIIFLLIIVFTMSFSYGDIVSVDGGVVGDPTLKSNTYEYKEVIFISGEPIELIGTVAIPAIPKDKEKYSLSYKYSLQNIEKKVTLDRTIKYDVILTRDELNKQTIVDVKMPDTSGLSESITIDSDSYDLSGYEFSKSSLYDNTPAVDYYSGAIYLKRIYYKNGDNIANDGKVILESSTDTLVGYNHYWGDAETQITNHKITYKDDDDSLNWQGFAISRMSALRKTSFQYLETDPQNISFRGNYVKTTTKENVLQYSYDLPLISGGTITEGGRNKGEISIGTDLITDRKSLIVPKLRDIGGHWAEDSIFLLSSLQIFKNDSLYFSPDTPINRADFAVALANAMADIKPLTQTDWIKLYRNTEGHPYKDYNPNGMVEESLFEIMRLTYNHVKFLKDEGVTYGMGNTAFFYPKTNITRAEAINMIIRALGIENLAPAPPYKTRYLDDEDIPFWAKDAVYMANEVGIITGYEDGKIRPNNYVSRADAAVFIENFIDHIKDDISYDYREKIINRD